MATGLMDSIIPSCSMFHFLQSKWGGGRVQDPPQKYKPHTHNTPDPRWLLWDMLTLVYRRVTEDQSQTYTQWHTLMPALVGHRQENSCKLEPASQNCMAIPPPQPSVPPEKGTRSKMYPKNTDPAKQGRHVAMAHPTVNLYSRVWPACCSGLT